MSLFLTKRDGNCILLLVEQEETELYNNVKNVSKGGSFMRKTYIDNIRWITVVLVVLYHVIYMFNGVQTAGVLGPFTDVQYQDVYQYMVYPWFMLLLFVVSGMSARYCLENHTHKEFLKSRTVKLLVPSTLGLFVFWWILGYYNMAFSGAITQMGQIPKPILFLIMAVSGTGALWYIQLLWVFSLVLVLIRMLEKDRFYNVCKKTNVPILILLTALIWGAAQILNTPIVVVYRFGIYGVGFLIGYFCLSHDEVMERVGRFWIPLSVAGVVAGIAFVAVYWGSPYAEHSVLDTPLCNVFAWLATLGVLAFMKKWGNFSNSFSKWMTARSWGLYLFHYLALAMCAYYLSEFAPGLPAVLMYLFVGIAAFGGAFLLYAIIRRIPFLRWCVCGISKKEKKAKQKI